MSPLDRFVAAQRDVYPQVLAELADGAKRTHWMWFVFPQIEGLGRSPTAQHFALPDLDAASAYLDHSLLADRLRECTALMLEWSGRRSAEAILGPVDSMKLRSSMTLFECAGAAQGEGLFAQVLEAFFNGSRDEVTLRILAR